MTNGNDASKIQDILTYSLIAITMATVALAGIPEPDAIVYGSATLQGVAVVATDHVMILARVAEATVPVGLFSFDEAAPNDCNRNGIADACDLSCAGTCAPIIGCGRSEDISPADGMPDECPGDNYVLRIRLESLADGSAPSRDAARVGQMADIFVQRDGFPEMFVRRLLITTRGLIRNVALSTIDWFSYPGFRRCLRGPELLAAPSGCSADQFDNADYEQDGDVDLRDFAVVQQEFIGS